MSAIPVRAASPCDAHGCAACCYDTEMPITREDADRLAKLGHDEAAFAARDADGFLVLATVEPSPGMPGRPCFFLKENRCSVYADRPQGCRIYPLVLTEQARLVRDEDCPHRAEFAMDPSAKRRIQKIYAQLGRERRR